MVVHPLQFNENELQHFIDEYYNYEMHCKTCGFERIQIVYIDYYPHIEDNYCIVSISNVAVSLDFSDLNRCEVCQNNFYEARSIIKSDLIDGDIERILSEMVLNLHRHVIEHKQKLDFKKGKKC